MATYGDDYNSLRRRNQSYFAGANPGAGNLGFPLAPGVAAGNARIAQLQAQGTPSQNRAGGSMIFSPTGTGSMWVPASKLQSYLSQGYTTKPLGPNLEEAKKYGYGAPNPPAPQIVPGAGGNYLSQGGVMNPVENLPVNSPYSTFSSNLQKTAGGKLLSAIGGLAYNAMAGLGQRWQNQNQLANRGMSGMMSPQSQNFYAYNPSPVPYQPRRYFDTY